MAQPIPTLPLFTSTLKRPLVSDSSELVIEPRIKRPRVKGHDTGQNDETMRSTKRVEEIDWTRKVTRGKFPSINCLSRKKLSQ